MQPLYRQLCAARPPAPSGGTPQKESFVVAVLRPENLPECPAALSRKRRPLSATAHNAPRACSDGVSAGWFADRPVEGARGVGRGEGRAGIGLGGGDAVSAERLLPRDQVRVGTRMKRPRACREGRWRGR